MNNFIKIFIFTSILMLTLTGCGPYEKINGVNVPPKEKFEKNSSVKVYFDETATINREKMVMKKTIEIFSKGIDSLATFRRVQLKSEPNINFARTTSLFVVDGKYYDYAISEISDADTIGLADYVKIHEDKEAKQIKIDLIEKERKLVVNKTYTSHIDLFVDVLKIGHAFTDKAFIELQKEFGFSKFIIDGKEIIDNKRIVLIPITAKYSHKYKLESQLTTRGFKIVHNKEEADEVVELETIAYMKGKYLKEFSNNSQIATVKKDAQMPQLAMDLNSFSGGSSGSSAAIGGALFLLNFLGSDMREVYHYILTARKVHEGETKFVSFYPLKYSSLLGIYLNYKYIDKKDRKDGFSHKTESMEEFIHEGSSYNSNDKNITLE